MPALLQPDGNRRVVAERLYNLGNGRRVLEYNGEFFFETGEYLADMTVVDLLPSPHRQRARAFVEKFIKVKEAAEAADKVVPTSDAVITVETPKEEAVVAPRGLGLG